MPLPLRRLIQRFVSPPSLTDPLQFYLALQAIAEVHLLREPVHVEKIREVVRRGPQPSTGVMAQKVLFRMRTANHWDESVVLTIFDSVPSVIKDLSLAQTADVLHSVSTMIRHEKFIMFDVLETVVDAFLDKLKVLKESEVVHNADTIAIACAAVGRLTRTREVTESLGRCAMLLLQHTMSRSPQLSPMMKIEVLYTLARSPFYKSQDAHARNLLRELAGSRVWSSLHAVHARRACHAMQSFRGAVPDVIWQVLISRLAELSQEFSSKEVTSLLQCLPKVAIANRGSRSNLVRLLQRACRKGAEIPSAESAVILLRLAPYLKGLFPAKILTRLSAIVFRGNLARMSRGQVITMVLALASAQGRHTKWLKPLAEHIFQEMEDLPAQSVCLVLCAFARGSLKNYDEFFTTGLCHLVRKEGFQDLNETMLTHLMMLCSRYAHIFHNALREMRATTQAILNRYRKIMLTGKWKALNVRTLLRFLVATRLLVDVEKPLQGMLRRIPEMVPLMNFKDCLSVLCSVGLLTQGRAPRETVDILVQSIKASYQARLKSLPICRHTLEALAHSRCYDQRAFVLSILRDILALSSDTRQKPTDYASIFTSLSVIGKSELPERPLLNLWSRTMQCYDHNPHNPMVPYAAMVSVSALRVWALSIPDLNKCISSHIVPHIDSASSVFSKELVAGFVKALTTLRMTPPISRHDAGQLERLIVAFLPLPHPEIVVEALVVLKSTNDNLFGHIFREMADGALQGSRTYHIIRLLQLRYGHSAEGFRLGMESLLSRREIFARMTPGELMTVLELLEPNGILGATSVVGLILERIAFDAVHEGQLSASYLAKMVRLAGLSQCPEGSFAAPLHHLCQHMVGLTRMEKEGLEASLKVLGHHRPKKMLALAAPYWE